MDRLIKPEVQELNLAFIKGQKCSQTFNLRNLMHTMPVAVSLTSTDPSVFSLHPCLSVIPPLSTASFSLSLTKPYDQPPLSTPPAAVVVRSSMLPTRKASHDHLLHLFSKPGPHIFKDATIPISLVGLNVAQFLLSPCSNSLELDFQFSKAISVCDEQQLTSLLRAAVANGKSYLISTLIEAGAEVSCRERSDDEESLLCLAIRSERIESLQLLIESGCAVDPRVDLLLHAAVAVKRVDMMEIVCLSYVDLDLNAVDVQGRTALHIAALNGHVEAIQFLVSVGADVDVTDHEGWTPLHFAAEHGHLDAVERLLGHAVFAKYAVNRDGKTAFGLAVERGNSHLYDALQLGDVLQRAARVDDVHTMKSCLAQGAKVNGVDQNGWSPLHRAAFKGHLESVRILVSHGARLDSVDGSGYTPLLRAVEAGHVEVAMYLLSHGAKASLKSLGGLAKFDLEGFNNHPSLVNPLH
ncbi:protein VAPYRIN-LIKE-like [Salvia miltiorrhiza]|uniref:protein VAPYRIN-LIKE-like n=1 Tax=Salvia miltiorrhiza TaxID=226208 RepID=UPI0025AD060B|nr:protein VAPYRIN-LIKE-like [Salvia miltiorrhiza]